MSETIPFDDFLKLDIRIGLVRAAERVPETDKLIKCVVDFGELGERTIVSGIAQHHDPAGLVGRRLPYIVNLESRVIKGITSEGMLLALSYGENDFSLLVPERDVPLGTKVR